MFSPFLPVHSSMSWHCQLPTAIGLISASFSSRVFSFLCSKYSPTLFTNTAISLPSGEIAFKIFPFHVLCLTRGLDLVGRNGEPVQLRLHILRAQFNPVDVGDALVLPIVDAGPRGRVCGRQGKLDLMGTANSHRASRRWSRTCTGRRLTRGWPGQPIRPTSSARQSCPASRWCSPRARGSAGRSCAAKCRQPIGPAAGPGRHGRPPPRAH
jgi:hypothetical protein